MKKLKKIAMLTDIHFGKRNNSDIHNQDCLNFITFFCDQVRKDPEIDCIGFLGDWNENRSALNINTLNYSYRGAKMLNSLGLPVYFLVGNHDLFHRHTRDIHSVIPFNEFDNFIVIEENTIIEDVEGSALFCPYLFHEEYSDLVKYNNIPVWFGHFEFKGYEVTGYGMKMPTGPDAEVFDGPKHIFSGHFHKRQVYDNSNVKYIGNTFPMDYGDAGDENRGMAVYDFSNDDLQFINWTDCPKYTKTTMTALLDNSVTLSPNSRVKCVVDVPISFEESTALRQSFMEAYKLREFSLEESITLQEAISETESEIDWDDTELSGVDELVEYMLNNIDTKHIKNEKLVSIYRDLTPQK